MKPDRRESFDDRLGDELRSWLRDRDAGSAPERLRMRVAHVAERPVHGRESRALQAMAGLMAAAAIAIVLLLSLALRLGPIARPAASDGSGPSASISAGPSAASSATPTVAMSPDLPYGTWAPTGSGLALPMGDGALNALAWTFLLAGSGLLLLVGARTILDMPTWADELPPIKLRGILRRAWPWRVGSILLAATLVAGGAGLLTASQFTPLVYGPYIGGGSDFLGWSGDPQTGYKAYVPGSEERVGISVENIGDLPLTVTSFDLDRFRAEQPAFSAFLESAEIRLPPGSTIWSLDWTGPFHPFELQPNTATTLTLVLKLKRCPATVVAGPASPPPGGISASYRPETGTVGFELLPFHYSVLGIERVADLRMTDAIDFVFGNDPVDCGG